MGAARPWRGTDHAGGDIPKSLNAILPRFGVSGCIAVIRFVAGAGTTLQSPGAQGPVNGSREPVRWWQGDEAISRAGRSVPARSHLTEGNTSRDVRACIADSLPLHRSAMHGDAASPPAQGPPGSQRGGQALQVNSGPSARTCALALSAGGEGCGGGTPTSSMRRAASARARAVHWRRPPRGAWHRGRARCRSRLPPGPAASRRASRAPCPRTRSRRWASR